MLAYVSRADAVTFGRGWWHNHVLLVAVCGSLALQAPAFATGTGRALLGLAALPPAGWLLAAGAAAATVVGFDAARLARARLSG